MGLPRKLKNFAVFVDGTNYMGEVPEVTLPTLARKTEEYRSGGMNGNVAMDFGLDGLIEIEIKTAGVITDLLRSFGAPTHDAAQFRFAGAYQADDTAAVVPVEVVGRGRLTEFNPGSSKSGDATEQTFKFVCSYYKLTINGEVAIEIDIVGGVEIIMGEDRMSAINAALGV